MPPDSKSPKGPKKGTKQHRPTAKEAAALKYSDSEEEGGSSSSSSNSSSKSKNRQPVKPRQKSSSTKGSGSNPSAVVKHPKSRPNLILSKKTKSLMKQQQQAQAHKAQQKGGRNSPELKKTSPKSKAPKSKSRSGKVSGGGSSGGGGGGRSSSGLSCSKSVGPKGTTTSKSPGGHSKQQLHQAKTSVETVGSVQKTGGGGGGGGNTIIFLGSPSDPAALELLKNLVKQINPSTSEAKQQQPPQQPTSASTTTTKTTTSSPEDQTVVTDQTQLEEVYDAMYDLANNVKTIHDSYEKIVASLVNLQHRRSKTKKEGKGGGAVEKGGTLIPAATKSATSASSDGSEDAPPPPPPPPPTPTTPTDPTDISRFMDARTRADAFAELFATVETLKEAMTPFNGCFNEGGFFQAATYAAETGRQITVGQRAAWLVQIRALNVTVEKLLAEYNREVLDMFRLVSSSGG
ncbi:hypothetical protein TYRP_006689 [Tyrophagus putrescentiae]|nr:hypothetical protein TYRP_006689 [Tyrophagus putrescentiae]